MNYEENKIDWQIDDLVIHDADAKKHHMLATIVEKSETRKGMMYRMEYLDKQKNYEKWWNTKQVLHDPKRFNIPLREK